MRTTISTEKLVRQFDSLTAVDEVALKDGVTSADALRDAIGDDVSAVFLQQPNFLGAVEDVEADTGADSEAKAACRVFDGLEIGVVVRERAASAEIAATGWRIAGSTHASSPRWRGATSSTRKGA